MAVPVLKMLLSHHRTQTLGEEEDKLGELGETEMELRGERKETFFFLR